MDSEKKLESKINVIKDEYHNNESKMLHLLDLSIKSLKSNDGCNVFLDINNRIIYRIVGIVFLLLIGLINIKYISLYYLGLLLFLFGFYVSFFGKKLYLLLFIISGLLGLYFIAMSIVNINLDKYFLIKILQDSPSTLLIIYLFIIAILLLATIISVFLFSLKIKSKSKNNGDLIPLLMFSLSIFMSLILKYIINYIN